MTRVFRIAVAATLLASVVGGGTGAAMGGGYALPLVRVTTIDGIVLAAERNERTLYVRTDAGSLCTGICSLDWPPFLISPDDFPTDGLVVVHRPDGRRQWSLGDRPLHFFVGDAARGDANGDGIGRWRALRPVGSDHVRQGGRARNGRGGPLL